MNNQNPTISVITVVYNAVDLLEGTIQSVLEQSYSNIEYVIVDGASKDGTVDIIKKYEDRIDTWVSEPDKGLY
ncbi:MAG: glycosyltransferase, partial [Bacteroidota bacterium]